MNYAKDGVNHYSGMSPVGTQGIGDAVKMSAVDRKLSDLDNSLSELRSLSAGLVTKLQNVLDPQMSAGSPTKDGAPKPVVAPLVERLDAINAGFVHELAIFRDIFNRIAV